MVGTTARLRLVSDVPLGAFLSGGLDSSTVVASMCRAHGARDTHTFSVGFDEPTYSELPMARIVADSLHVHHREETVTPDVAAEIDRILDHTDEPFADTSFIPTYFLARFARQHATVCLSGDGGDELFAGYNTYVADKIHRVVRHLPRSILSASHALADRLLPVTKRKVGLDYKLRQFLKGASLPSIQAHYSWRTIFPAREGLQVLSPELCAAVEPTDAYHDFATWQQDVADCHYLDQAMYVDIKTWLADDILVKLDRATMAHALEARPPLLDHRLVEFAASLPVDLKLRGFRTKYLLKQSQRGRLPGAIIRRSKQGFNAPMSHWIETSLHDRLDAVLSSRKTRPIFSRPYIEGLREAHQRGQADNGLKLYGILCLGLWINQQ